MKEKADIIKTLKEEIKTLKYAKFVGGEAGAKKQGKEIGRLEVALKIIEDHDWRDKAWRKKTSKLNPT